MGIELFEDSPYIYNGMHVPRVTEILGKMLAEDYLMKWAHKMGSIHKDMDAVRDAAADTGTLVHKIIEDFLRYRMLPDFNLVPGNHRRLCRNCFDGFLLWITNIENCGLFWRPLLIEHTIVTPLYGGTLDLLIEIGGRNYLIDFKTSHQMSWKYCLQLAAYWSALSMPVDGCMVIRFNKYKPCFPEEMVFDFDNNDMYEFIKSCSALFTNIASAYWGRASVEFNYKNITGLRR